MWGQTTHVDVFESVDMEAFDLESSSGFWKGTGQTNSVKGTTHRTFLFPFVFLLLLQILLLMIKLRKQEEHVAL